MRTILRNRAYIGYVSSGGVEFRGAHPLIIGEELWVRCASIREARERRPTATRLTSSVDVFPQRVYYMSCGGRCHHYTSGQPNNRNGYYRCVSRRAAGERRTDCQASGVPITTVEQQIIELLASIKITDELRTVLHEEAARAVALARPALEVDRGVIEQKLARLGEVYADGLIGREEYQQRAAELRRQMGTPITAAAGPDLDTVLAVLADLPRVVRSATPAELRAIVTPMCSHVWTENKQAVAITPTAEFEAVFQGIWKLGLEVVKRCPTGLDAPLTTSNPAALRRADRSLYGATSS